MLRRRATAVQSLNRRVQSVTGDPVAEGASHDLITRVVGTEPVAALRSDITQSEDSDIQAAIEAVGLTTASGKVDLSTYWRCEACGQMWNVGRLRASSRYGYEGR